MEDPEKVGVFVKEVKAHFESVVSMSAMKLDAGGIITCSLDKRVRIWSSHLELLGTIDQSDPSIEKLDPR